MTWRNTEYEDLHRIVIPTDPAMDVRSMANDTQEVRDSLKQDARTWEEDGHILAIVAVAHMWQGVGMVWTLLTEEARERGVILTRGVLQFITMLHDERGYWRLQATIEHGDEIGARWILRLGFQYEGTLWKYGPNGKTHDMYSRCE